MKGREESRLFSFERLLVGLVTNFRGYAADLFASCDQSTHFREKHFPVDLREIRCVA